MQLEESTIRAQYLAVKRAYPDALVFIRANGDMYRAFDDDARTASQVVGLPLNEHRATAAFAISDANAFTAKLTALGYRVALVDQVTEQESNQP